MIIYVVDNCLPSLIFLLSSVYDVKQLEDIQEEKTNLAKECEELTLTVQQQREPNEAVPSTSSPDTLRRLDPLWSHSLCVFIIMHLTNICFSFHFSQRCGAPAERWTYSPTLGSRSWSQSSELWVQCYWWDLRTVSLWAGWCEVNWIGNYIILPPTILQCYILSVFDTNEVGCCTFCLWIISIVCL